MDELNILVEHLVENGYTSTYEDALSLLPSMSENWTVSILQEYLEENYLFNYIMEMRKEDRVRGKGKTPLYLYSTRKRIERPSQGTGKKWELKQYQVKAMNPVAAVGRTKQGITKYPGHGIYSDYAPHPHGKGGLQRGVKKVKGEKRVPQPGTPEYQLNRSKAYQTYNKRKAYERMKNSYSKFDSMYY